MANADTLYGKIWSEKEYLIVLHYYFKYKDHPQHADCDYIQKLSKLMGRTPHSILYRMQNYASIDPDEKKQTRKGKVNISDLGRELFKKWSKKKDTLKDCVEVFLRDEETNNQPTLFNPAPIRLPRAFEKYELLDQIGRGGFGEVFSCLDSNGKEFAIKIIDKVKLYDQECIHRFRREIKSLKSIKHPNVIVIHEDNLDKEKNYPGFVMDLGKHTLTQYLTKSREKNDDPDYRPVLGFEKATHIFKSMMNAVEALHSASTPIIHRDINPNNILQLYDDTWVLADFSLAKFLPPEPVSTTFATNTFQVMGTAHYTSPEQYRSLKNTDERTDIYALGWLLWDLFSSAYPPPRREDPGLPQNLENVFQKAVEWNSDDRFQSVQKLRETFSREIQLFSDKYE